MANDYQTIRVFGCEYELHIGEVVIACPICADVFQANKDNEEECPGCGAIIIIRNFHFLAEYKDGSWIKTPESSSVSGYGYNSETKILTVGFGKAKYKYFGVPNEVMEAMTKAKSVGSFLAREIKPNFKFEKV